MWPNGQSGKWSNGQRRTGGWSYAARVAGWEHFGGERGGCGECEAAKVARRVAAGRRGVVEGARAEGDAGGVIGVGLKLGAAGGAADWRGSSGGGVEGSEGSNAPRGAWADVRLSSLVRDGVDREVGVAEVGIGRSARGVGAKRYRRMAVAARRRSVGLGLVRATSSRTASAAVKRRVNASGVRQSGVSADMGIPYPSRTQLQWFCSVYFRYF